MPGTIHVTVLEFKGASSSSNPSAKSLKVSMGKRHYQTWDKGDFSFPVTKLKEDLIVKLLDAGENELAHADIGTIQVIEKGCWDGVFTLEGEGGGGHVHMKLQFILSDEDRKRIRVMRESVMKKKQETNANINLRLSDSSDAVQTSARGEQKIADSRETFLQINVALSPKVEASEVDSSLNFPTSSTDSPYSYPEQERRIPGSEIPVKELSIEAEGASSSLVNHEIQAESSQVHQGVQSEKTETYSQIIIFDKKSSVIEKLEDDRINKSQNRGPQKLSSNVWKMISAFEPRKFQDKVHMDSKQEAKSTPKAPKVVVQPADRSFNEVKDDINLYEKLHQTPIVVITRADIAASNTELSHAAKELESSVTPSPSSEKPSNGDNILRKVPREFIAMEPEKSPSDVLRRSTLETATNSGRIHEEQSREASNVEDISIEGSSEPLVKEMEKSVVDETGQSTLKTALSLERTHEEQSREASNVEDISIEGLTEPIVKEMENSAVEETGQSTLETSTSLGRKHEEQYRETELKVGGSDERPKSLDHYEEQYYSSESSGIWIFPDNTRRLCITTAGDPSLEAKHHQEKKISPEKETLEKENSASQKESGTGSSPDVSFNGVLGQVIKVVAILGFGVLVFLTRQKEPRTKKREERVGLFTIPSYTGGTSLID